MSEYDFRAISQRIKAAIERRGDFRCDMALLPKLYVLGMFPYPSGQAHMGHVRVYTLTDVMARYMRLHGHNVLNPVGWDAFGLPAENAAIKNRTRPDEWTARNIQQMKDVQFANMGWCFDWDKELNTASPEYYRWTQWLFLQLFKHGKAYKARALVNWCDHDQTVLADEQVIDGRCWRDGSPVRKRHLEQWFLKLSEYSERLWDDLSKLKNWSSEAVAVQRNWINRSEGATVDFEVPELGEKVSVFTTRVDTLFGVTALVLAPEHPLVSRITALGGRAELEAYVQQAIQRSAVERMASKEKTGVATRVQARHPLTGQPVELWVGDYVIASYGTGAVMCVPAHDERDYEFARRHGMPVLEVIRPPEGQGSLEASAFVEDGVLVNSGEFDGQGSAQARRAIAERLAQLGRGQLTVIYNLRDWSVGRQRYWGCPIPMIECPKCGPVGVPEEQLPVVLPRDVSFEQGKATIPPDSPFLRVDCPQCGGAARRETDTLDTFVCSSWYAFRFLDPHNDRSIFDSAVVNRWMPLDFYVGGLEHAGQHMIYFRFLTKFLHDIGLLAFDEPVDHFFCNGMVRKDGEKMSKSKGNVVVPTDVIDRYGADALRLYILSDTPAEQDIDWDDSGIFGKLSFVRRNYRIISEFLHKHYAADFRQADLSRFSEPELLYRFYSFLSKVASDIQGYQFHNAVARVHEVANSLLKALEDAQSRTPEDRRVLCLLVHEYLIILGMFTPFLAEELYNQSFDPEGGIFNRTWPKVEERFLQRPTVTLVIQVNGKKRHTLELRKDATEPEVEQAVLADPAVQRLLQGVSILKKVHVPNRLYNIVVGQTLSN